MNRIITLTTDFGTRDGFVGAIKGVILSINPRALIVDITHDIEPQNIRHAAFVIAASAAYYPPKTIHVVVVDPGVGTTRQPIVANARGMFFVAPANGVLALVMPRDSNTQTFLLNESKYWLREISNTFHGRDIFAPVAAHISLGVPLTDLGELIDLKSEPDWFPKIGTHRNGEQVGQIIHVDRFGNLITNFSAETLDAAKSKPMIKIAGRQLRGLKQTYADGARGELIALINSFGLMEIAIRDGNAAQELQARVGTPVTIL
ncbi:MAG: SAM-dependent chlorinase/fluorinase [Chloroflexi bacterium]|nr:SAM-dependent chlorinase/fluorinase [Chloroflexota bacterium]